MDVDIEAYWQPSRFSGPSSLLGLLRRFLGNSVDSSGPGETSQRVQRLLLFSLGRWCTGGQAVSATRPAFSRKRRQGVATPVKPPKAQLFGWHRVYRLARRVQCRILWEQQG